MKKRKFLLILLLTLGMGLLTTTTRATDLEWDGLYQIPTGISYKKIAETAGGGAHKAGVYSEDLKTLKQLLSNNCAFELTDTKKVKSSDYDKSKDGLWEAAKKVLSINNKDYIYCLSDIFSGSGETENDMKLLWPSYSFESFDRIRVAMWRENKSKEVNLTVICAPFLALDDSFSDLEVYNFKKVLQSGGLPYYVDVSYSEKNVNKKNSLTAIINRYNSKLDVNTIISKATGDYKAIKNGIAESDINVVFLENEGQKNEKKCKISDVRYNQFARLIFYSITTVNTRKTDGTKKTPEEIEKEMNEELEKQKAQARKYDAQVAGVTGTERGPTTYNDVLENVNVYDPGNVTETGGVLDIGSKILGGINIVGVVASVIILAVLGLRFIMGSVEEKAEIKESLVPYVIGIVLFVGITTIVNILYNFGQSLK